jgi:tRNA(Ile)-lysidine synthase TilS/MesJ
VKISTAVEKKIIVSLSGGKDSTAMLHMWQAFKAGKKLIKEQ